MKSKTGIKARKNRKSRFTGDELNYAMSPYFECAERFSKLGCNTYLVIEQKGIKKRDSILAGLKEVR